MWRRLATGVGREREAHSDGDRIVVDARRKLTTREMLSTPRRLKGLGCLKGQVKCGDHGMVRGKPCADSEKARRLLSLVTVSGAHRKVLSLR